MYFVVSSISESEDTHLTNSGNGSGHRITQDNYIKDSDIASCKYATYIT